MEKTEKIAELSQEEIDLLRTKRFAGGCWILSIGIIIIAVFFAYYFLPIVFSGGSNGFWIRPVIAVLIFGLLVWGLTKYIKRANEPLDRDIQGGCKKIIVAPIDSKRTEAYEHGRGPKRGQITMSYFMTVAGKEYVMAEDDYLQIRSGEFLEMHIAPTSNFVLSQKWLKTE